MNTEVKEIKIGTRYEVDFSGLSKRNWKDVDDVTLIDISNCKTRVIVQAGNYTKLMLPIEIFIQTIIDEI